MVGGYFPSSPHHEEAAEILDGHPRLVGHAAFETYSVLTRLPPPARQAPAAAAAFVRSITDEPHLLVDGALLLPLLERSAGGGITGAAVYDALIAETCRTHDLELVSADRRAVRTYERIGVRYRLIG